MKKSRITRPELGEWGETEKIFYRSRRGTEGSAFVIVKTWIHMRVKRRRVMFVGYRTIYNGIVQYNMGDDPPIFIQQGTLEAWLVVDGPRRRPYLIPPESWEPVAMGERQ